MKTLPNLDTPAEIVKYRISVYVRIFVVGRIGQTSINFDYIISYIPHVGFGITAYLIWGEIEKKLI